MDDHGDDFSVWVGDGQPDPFAYRTEEDWAAIAGYVRHSANKLGQPLPLCLPGEPQACGRSSRQHVMAWGAELKARAQRVIEDAAPSPAHATYASGPLYQHHLATLRQPRA
ncbi:hypothetical protein ACFQ7O_24205 [Streptomyces sp. NPDC056485]|uniref:hypothetical protein n=1 Tax=Streptomyces sp. NPDC056485 TaxID=3345834 RepID=UPI00367CFD18